MIKVILEHYISKADKNGNRYSKCRVVDCKTRKDIVINVPHNSNAYRLVKGFGFHAASIYEVRHEVPIRRFNAIECINKHHDLDKLEKLIREWFQSLYID